MALTRVKSAGATGGYLSSVSTSNLPAGSTLQVVHRNHSALLSTTTNSFIDVTDYNVSITPSSTSNKILLIVNPTFSINGHGTVRLTRSIGGATATTAGFVGDQELGSRTPGTFHQYTTSSYNTGYDPKSAGITFFDSPNTTSAVVYQIQVGSPHSSGYTVRVNAPVLDGNANWSTRLRSSMTAIEVKQ